MYVTKSPAKLAGTCSEHSWRYAVLACHREGILASGRRIVHRYSSGNSRAASGRGYVDFGVFCTTPNKVYFRDDAIGMCAGVTWTGET